VLTTERLTLTPLAVEDADEMVSVLADPVLYRHIGGGPPSYDELAARYARQVAGSSRAGDSWRNWIVRLDGQAVGYVQATVLAEDTGPVVEVAWVVATAYAGKGFATEAAAAMVQELREREHAIEIRAHIHDDNAASQAVARKLGLVETDVFVAGERRWTSPPRTAGISSGSAG
jgi:RimJ/RimL family protein N-acetyltransferase